MDAIKNFTRELLKFDVFSGLQESDVLDLCTDATIVTSEHRSKLFKAGEPADFFGVVLSGAYKLYKTGADSEDVIVHFATPGDTVAAFIMPKPGSVYPVSAASLGSSKIIKIPRQNYLNQWKARPDVIFKVQELMLGRIAILHDEKLLAKASLQKKVAHLLLLLFDKNPGLEGQPLPLPLTRKEIANTLGSSVEAVIRIMSEWSKEGIIQTIGKHIQILKPEKMIKILESSQES